MAAQLTRAERNRRADDIVINHGDLADLYQQLYAVHQQYLQLSQAG
jgi:dephospho-CoA kinase